MSRPSEPVETTDRSFCTWASPIFMMEPLPNCFSICASAAASALFLLSSIAFIPLDLPAATLLMVALAVGSLMRSLTGSLRWFPGRCGCVVGWSSAVNLCVSVRASVCAYRSCVSTHWTTQLWHRTIVRCHYSEALGKAVEQPLQRYGHRVPADSSTVAGEVQSSGRNATWPGPGEAHRADRFLGRSARWAGDAGDRDRPLRLARGEGTARHREGGLLTHRPEALDDLGRNPDLLGLRRIRVGDEAALEPSGAARHGGDRASDQAAGA